MSYPGGKNGAGVYQAIINQMPPHRVYIEAFAGGGAILRLKRPASVNIGIDKDEVAISGLAQASGIPADIAIYDDVSAVISENNDAGYGLVIGDALEFLRRYPFKGDELVYCDPPYLHETRTKLDLYRHEMTQEDHSTLLAVLLDLSCMVMVSGYHSSLYAARLNDWHHIQFQAMTRSGKQATEWLWMNFAPPVELHDYSFLGTNFRERERIKRKKDRWTARLENLPLLERQALLAAIREAWPPAAPSETTMAESDTAVFNEV